MRAFYADLVRGSRFSLLAGPFPSEAVARKYEHAAFKAACEIDRKAVFDSYGVVSIKDYDKPGLLNERIKIDPADLGLAEQEAA